MTTRASTIRMDERPRITGRSKWSTNRHLKQISENELKELLPDCTSMAPEPAFVSAPQLELIDDVNQCELVIYKFI